VLGLDLVVEGDNLRFYDPRTGEWLLTHEEAQTARQLAEAQAQREATARQLAEAQAQREATARQAAEAELVRLREEIARLQKGAG
jgi:predicted NBD/HSP70 family sugar kinase